MARRGRRPEAAAAFRLAARLDPKNPLWCKNLATAALDGGDDTASAEQWALEGLLLDPGSADLHRLLGHALARQREFSRAADALAEAAGLNPELPDIHPDLARFADLAGRPAIAEPAYREAVRRKPSDAGLRGGLAAALARLNRPADAEAAGREAVRLAPEAPEARLALGIALAAGDRHDDALECHAEAARMRPDWAPPRSNRGSILAGLGRLAEAETELREALRLAPASPEYHMNLGTALAQSGDLPAALKLFDEALRLNPDYPEARLNRALTLLSAGRLEEGWADYESRWEVVEGGAPKCPAPRWDGGPLDGKVILLHAEQGLGDNIQFARYAPLVKARGAREVVIDAPRPLAGLLATCPGVDRSVPRGQTITGLHLHIPILSLPGILGAPPQAALPEPPYLTPPAGRVAYWKNELAGDRNLRVGIAWQGSRSHKGDRLRSVPLARFAGLAAVPGVTLHSLQKGFGTEQLAAVPGFPVIDLGARTEEGMEDAAAAMLALDLVISVDSALVHLAGAVGVRAWVAVPFAADWRWRREGEETIWYPSLTLFRQPAPNDWDSVFEQLAARLAKLSAARGENNGGSS